MRVVASLVIVLALATATAWATEAGDDANPMSYGAFASWMTKYNKIYSSSSSEQRAFDNYRASVERAATRQARYDARWGAGVTGFGATLFADLTPEEWRAKYLTGLSPAGLRERHSTLSVVPPPAGDPAPPTEWDWRKKNAVTPVKDQGQCGSCWAFSVVETIESSWFLSGQPLTTLSEQQVVDCDKVDEGCDGGDPPVAYQYIMNATGLESERTYPYTAMDGHCKFDASKVVAKISNWSYAVPPCTDSCKHQNETVLKQQLVALGPLSICVQADDAWQDYQWGPLMEYCPSDFQLLNHAVQLVGYQSMGLYLVRNSWSDQWGEQGYIRLRVGENACGLADEVTIARI
jgi:C1A family cysteine protease